jgi:hypothetical protein
MTLRLVQPGMGANPPLVAMFKASPVLDSKSRAAFGPAPCIVADVSDKGTETLVDILEFAYTNAGVSQFSKLALIGYSAGCQRVRKLRIDGANADAFLLSDGTHASWPPQEWQIAWLRDLAAQARKGKVLVVASHTWQTYTEKLTPPQIPYASTVTVLRQATGFPLEKGGPPEAPVVSNDGQLWVYSYASKDADMVAHSYQAMVVQPKLAAQHVAPWLLNGPQPVPTTPTKETRTSASSGGVDVGLILGGLALLARKLVG